MALLTAEGIVLKTQALGDTSRIVTLYTRDHGLRMLNLVRSPDFTAYLQKGDFSDIIDMISPRDMEKTLSVQVIPFGSSRKLLIGRDVTRLSNLEKISSRIGFPLARTSSEPTDARPLTRIVITYTPLPAAYAGCACLFRRSINLQSTVR